VIKLAAEASSGEVEPRISEQLGYSLNVTLEGWLILESCFDAMARCGLSRAAADSSDNRSRVMKNCVRLSDCRIQQSVV
jgi:hypothetical protein